MIPSPNDVTLAVLRDWAHALAPYALNTVFALAVLVLGWLGSKWISSALLVWFRKIRFDEAVGRFLATLLRWVFLGLGAVAALARLGVETSSFLALFASAGVAVGLALQGSLGHFASGVLILVLRPFELGDLVRVGGEVGRVRDIGLFFTTIVTADNVKVIVPNGQITTATVVNYTAMGTRFGLVLVSIEPVADLAAVRAHLIAAAQQIPGVVLDPPPSVALAGIGAHGLDLEVRAGFKVADYYAGIDALRMTVLATLPNARAKLADPPLDAVLGRK